MRDGKGRNELISSDLRTWILYCAHDISLHLCPVMSSFLFYSTSVATFIESGRGRVGCCNLLCCTLTASSLLISPAGYSCSKFHHEPHAIKTDAPDHVVSLSQFT